MRRTNFSDKELTFMLRRGDVSAFDVIYKRYGQQVYSYVFGIIKSREVSKSVVQEVFINLWNNKKNLKNMVILESFLFNTTYNLIIDSLKEKHVNNTITSKELNKSSEKDQDNNFKISSIKSNYLIANLDF